MSIWRAPLLIIGILLVLLAAAAVAAPWFIDWNRYRPQLEAWGKAATGREVKITGAVDFVLFPWPAARLHGVRVASAPGSRFRHLLTVEEVEARFSLGALFGGRLEVESVRLLRPVLSLEHTGNGHGNWELEPRATLRLPFSPERVSIDSVRIERGMLRLADRRLRAEFTVSEIEARIHAPRLTGPWRFRGKLTLLGHRWQARASTGEIERGRPVGVSLRLEPPTEVGGYAFSLDGALEPATREKGHPHFAGRLSLQPRIPRSRSNPLDPVRQVTLSARLRASPTLLELKELKIAPKFPQSSPFATITGNARVEAGRLWNASLLLRTSRLKLGPGLDRLLGLPPHDATRGEEGTLSALRRHLKALASLLPELPPELLLDVDAAATTVKAGAREFSRVSLSAEITPELFSIRHLEAELPEVASLAFQGDLLGGDVLQLTGRLEANAPNARGMIFSLFPATRTVLGEAWRGTAGSLSLVAALDLTDNSLRLVSHSLKLDDATLKLDWRRTETRDHAVADTIRLHARRWNIDRHLGAKPGSVLALARGLASLSDTFLYVEAAADELRLAGLDWRRINLAFSQGPQGISLKQLEVEDLGGLQLAASGVFHPVRQEGANAPWQGRLAAHLEGSEAASVWRTLTRFWPAAPAETPAWLKRLGAVNLNLDLNLLPGRKGPERSLRAILKGHAGPARIAFSSTAQGASTDWRKADWQVEAQLTSTSSAPLLALAGLRPVPREGPARVSLRANGVPAKGLAVEAAAALPGLDVSWKGQLMIPEDATAWPPRGEGDLSLTLENTAHWAAELNLAAPEGLTLQGRLRTAFSPRHLALQRLNLRLGNNQLGGELRLAWPDEIGRRLEGTRPTVKGTLNVDSANVSTIVTLLLGDSERPERLRERIAAGWALDVTLNADAVTVFRPAWRLPKAHLTLKTNEDGALNAELLAGDDVHDLQADIALRRQPLGLDTQVALQLALPLGPILRAVDDSWRTEGRLQMRLQAKGRAASLQGLLVSLKGNGGMMVKGVHFIGLSPQRLPDALRAIDDDASLKRFDEMARQALHAADWRWPQEVQAGLLLENGLLELTPAAWKQDGIASRLSGLFDLRTNRLDITLELAPRGTGPDVPPPYTLALAGSPGALELSPQLESLRDWLQQRLIRLKEERLRKLEEERRRLEEQARKLEEEQRRREEEERRRQRALELKQNADELRRKLQDVLSKAWQEELKRRRAPSTSSPGTSARPAPRTIEELIREAQQEDRMETATMPERSAAPDSASPSPALMKQPALEPVRPLPRSARARPKGPIVIVPHPRPAKLRALVARRRAERATAKKRPQRPTLRRSSEKKSAGSAAKPKTARPALVEESVSSPPGKGAKKAEASRGKPDNAATPGSTPPRRRIIFNWNSRNRAPGP